MNADFLSRFPTGVEPTGNANDDWDKISYVNFIDDFTGGGIDRRTIREESEKDPLINKVIEYVRKGWPPKTKGNAQVHQFFSRASELTVEQDILMWGHRVTIPSSLREKFLYELHSSHSGIVKMKSRARSYFWWPGMDKAIEKLAGECQACLQARPEPRKVPISPWPESTEPFQRVHIDHAGPFINRTYLIITDSFTKWIEVYDVKSLTSAETIEKLRNCFARFGVPDTIVSDNGRSFSSSEFQRFCSTNGIKHMTIAPHHPQSNGAAENAVKNFKSGLSKALADPKSSSTTTATLIDRYLFNYRSTAHVTTKKSPFAMLFGREMRTIFDKIRPCAERTENSTQFRIGDAVLVRDYSVSGLKWQPAEVKGVRASNMFVCCTGRGEWIRHANQMTKLKHPVATVVISNNDNINDFSCPIRRAGNTNPIVVADPGPAQLNDLAVNAGQGPQVPNPLVADGNNQDDQAVIVEVDHNQRNDRIALNNDDQHIDQIVGDEANQQDEPGFESEDSDLYEEASAQPVVPTGIARRTRTQMGRPTKQPDRLTFNWK